WQQQSITLPANLSTPSPPAKGALLQLPQVVPNAYAGEQMPAPPRSPAQPSQEASRPQTQQQTQQLQSQQKPQERPEEQPPPATPKPSPSSPPLSSVNLHGVHFISTDQGWAVGDNGTILHTNDGGRSWDLQSSGRSSELHSIYFTNDQHGWVVGWDGT